LILSIYLGNHTFLTLNLNLQILINPSTVNYKSSANPNLGMKNK